MSKHRPPYPPELREQLVAMVRAERSPEELARDYEPTAQSIRAHERKSADLHAVVREAERGNGKCGQAPGTSAGNLP